MTDSTTQREVLLAKYLDISPCDVEHSHDNTYDADGAEYMVLNDEEADAAAREYIEQSVWAFNADFLASHIDALDSEDIDRLRGDQCESVNDALIKLIDDFDHFVSDAIAADGRGHFMSSYDGEENEINDEGEWIYIYRTN